MFYDLGYTYEGFIGYILTQYNLKINKITSENSFFLMPELKK